MTEELIDLTQFPADQIQRAPLSEQIKSYLLQDAHAQRSHREIDAYLSNNQVFFKAREAVIAQSNNQSPSQRLDALDATKLDNQTVLGTTFDQILQKDSYFGSLSDQIRAQIIEKAEIKTYSPKESIFIKDQPAEAIFVVISGSILLNDQLLPPGRVLCLQSALQQQTFYNSTAVSVGESRIAIISKKLCIDTLFENQLYNLSKQGHNFHQYIQNCIKLSDEEIDLLSQLSNYQSFKRNDVICQQGQVLNSMYVVLDVFTPTDAIKHSLIANSNAIEQIMIPKENQQENQVQIGDIIGLQGVILGKEEKREYKCYGVVLTAEIKQEELRKRTELFNKLVKLLNE